MDVASKALSCPSHPLHHFNVFLQRIEISFGLTAQLVPAVTPVNVWAPFSRSLGNINMVAIVNVVDIVIGVSIVNGMGMLDIMDILDNVIVSESKCKAPFSPRSYLFASPTSIALLFLQPSQGSKFSLRKSTSINHTALPRGLQNIFFSIALFDRMQ